MTEEFSWKKFFTGVVDPINTAKMLSFALQIILIFLLCLGAVKGFLIVKTWLFPKPLDKPSIGIIEGGKVDASAGKKQKFGINIL